MDEEIMSYLSGEKKVVDVVVVFVCCYLLIFFVFYNHILNTINVKWNYVKNETILNQH